MGWLLVWLGVGGLGDFAWAKGHTNETVTLFPSMAWPAAGGQKWQFEVQGWIYEPEKRAISLTVLREMLGLKTGRMGAEGDAIFQERARLFLVDNESRKHLTVHLGTNTFTTVATGANGHFTQSCTVGNLAAQELLKAARTNGGWLTYTADFSNHVQRVASGEILVLTEPGVSVVSDVDDTIKVTEVRNHKAMLQNTFFRTFKSVKGMPELYQAWAKQGAQFHYVSASPWQLYPALADFRERAGFPGGTFHLKSFRVKDRSFFQLFAAPDKYKWVVIEPMMKRFPGRRFVLVGDSGEKDPEVYGRVARAFPEQVLKIYIHNVTGEGADAKRYPIAFKGLPLTLWQVFSDPAEVSRELPVGKREVTGRSAAEHIVR